MAMAPSMTAWASHDTSSRHAVELAHRSVHFRLGLARIHVVVAFFVVLGVGNLNLAVAHVDDSEDHFIPGLEFLPAQDARGQQGRFALHGLLATARFSLRGSRLVAAVIGVITAAVTTV